MLGTTTSEESTSWYLSDDLNPNPGDETSPYGLAFDWFGNLWSAGSLYDASAGSFYWYVRMSSNPTTSDSWKAMDEFPYDGGSASANSVAGDASGNVYVVGWRGAPWPPGGTYWLVRKATFSSVDQTWSWATADQFKSGEAYGIAFVPRNLNVANLGSGALFAVGRTTGSSGSWITRRSVDGGANWETVDTPSSGALANKVSGDAFGNVYVVGLGKIKVHGTQVWEWLVRESSDGGATWQTVDTYVDGSAAAPEGVGMDANGSPVVVGYGTGSDGYDHWIVRRPINGTWTTVDDWGGKDALGGSALAWGVTSDKAGNLLVTGRAQDLLGAWHWVVRSTP